MICAGRRATGVAYGQKATTIRKACQQIPITYNVDAWICPLSCEQETSDLETTGARPELSGIRIGSRA